MTKIRGMMCSGVTVMRDGYGVMRSSCRRRRRIFSLLVCIAIEDVRHAHRLGLRPSWELLARVQQGQDARIQTNNRDRDACTRSRRCVCERPGDPLFPMMMLRLRLRAVPARSRSRGSMVMKIGFVDSRRRRGYDGRRIVSTSLIKGCTSSPALNLAIGLLCDPLRRRACASRVCCN